MNGTELALAIYTALSAAFGGRVYPQVAPDWTPAPYAVYGAIASAPITTLANGSPIESSRYQLDVWGNTYLEAHTLAESARAAMLAIAYPISVILIMQADQYEPDVKLHRVIQDYSIWNPRSS